MIGLNARNCIINPSWLTCLERNRYGAFLKEFDPARKIGKYFPEEVVVVLKTNN